MRDARDVLKSPVISEKSVGLVEDNKYLLLGRSCCQ